METYTVTLEGGAQLKVVYKKVAGSGNAIVGAKYRTHVYLMNGSSQYDMGWEDGKLDTEEVKARFEQIVRSNQERMYGQQGTLLRRELPRRREQASERVQSATLRTRYRSTLQ